MLKQLVVLVKRFSYTPEDISVSVRSFPYTPGANFNEQLHLRSTYSVILVSGVSLTLLTLVLVNSFL